MLKNLWARIACWWFEQSHICKPKYHHEEEGILYLECKCGERTFKKPERGAGKLNYKWLSGWIK